MKPLIIIILSSSLFFTTVAQTTKEKPIADFKTQPSLQWKFKIPGKGRMDKTPILSSPVINDNLVYFGGPDSTFYALNLSTGKQTWTFRTKGAIRSTALVHGSNLYVNGGDGNLYQLDKKTGKAKWTFTGAGEKKYDFADYHHSSPVLNQNTIYYGAGNMVFAVNATTGAKVWSYQAGDAVHTTPALDNNKLFVGSFDGHVYALDATNGSLLWKFKTIGHRFFPKGEVQGSPAVTKGLVIIGARDYNVYALDQNKGFSHWNKAFRLGWVLMNTVHDSVVHMAGADERVLIAVQPATGVEYWKKKMEFLVFGNNAYSETMMYVGTTIGKLHGINAKTGDKVWTFNTDGYQANRLKYFKEDDSYRDDIYTTVKSSEHFLEVEYELGGIFSTPAITNEKIVFTTTEGTVYCLGR
jgi:outer membrane protein assembly factor BamB